MSKRHWAMVGAGGLAFLSMMAAFGTSPSTVTDHVSRQDITQDLPQPFANAAIKPLPATLFTREEKVRPGDTASTLLKRIEVDGEETLSQLRRTPNADIFFQQLAPGKTLTAQVDGEGQLQSLIFPLNGQQDQVLLIERGAEGFRAKTRPLATEVQVQMKSAEIRYSLFGATDAAGIPDGIASQLADIFGGDIDFHRDLRKGDRFSVIYEVMSAQGRMVRTGKILSAEFVNDGKTYRAVWFATSDGKGGYYAPDGKSLRKAFLRSPLEFSRVTSGFSSARFHPILQTWRAHKGVDYGAPIGTKVRATGDGVVEFAGTQGGYGKVVILRHQGRYSTVYGHLSAFVAGIRPGARVSQGDTIAYSGMSGLASGPHLHYEFRIDGVHQNPLTVALPGSPPLGPQQLGRFKQLATDQIDRLHMASTGNISALD